MDPREIIATEDKLYLVENGMIQILNRKGKYLGKINISWNDSKMSEYEGNLYVVNYRKKVIQIFDTSGKFIRNFGCNGLEDYKFHNPSAIAVDQDRIYVEDNGMIKIFGKKIMEDWWN